MVLSKEQVLGADDLKKESVSCPEWGGDLLVREPTAMEWDNYEQSLTQTEEVGKRIVVKGNFGNAKARLVVRCAIDESGKRLFTDEDADALGQKSATAIGRLFDVIERLGGVSQRAKERLEKNSEGGRAASSPSNSPAT